MRRPMTTEELFAKICGILKLFMTKKADEPDMSAENRKENENYAERGFRIRPDKSD